MLPSQTNFSKITVVIGLGITLNFGWASLSSRVKAEAQNSSSTGRRTTVNPNKRDNLQERSGLPIHRRGGGSRGNCIASEENLVALVPANAVGITASNTPQLFFYLPETTQPHLIEFVVRNHKDELVYDTMLQTSKQAGIIKIEFPPNLKQDELKTNEDYRWYLSMICNLQKRSHDVVVEGWIRRVEIDFTTNRQLQQAKPIEQASLYQQQGIWHDALSILAEQQKTLGSPIAVRAKWAELLDNVGLGELANKPFIEVNNLSSSNQSLERSAR